jgi:hypothetical protein
MLVVEVDDLDPESLMRLAPQGLRTYSGRPLTPRNSPWGPPSSNSSRCVRPPG